MIPGILGDFSRTDFSQPNSVVVPRSSEVTKFGEDRFWAKVNESFVKAQTQRQPAQRGQWNVVSRYVHPPKSIYFFEIA